MEDKENENAIDDQMDLAGRAMVARELVARAARRKMGAIMDEEIDEMTAEEETDVMTVTVLVDAAGELSRRERLRHGDPMKTYAKWSFRSPPRYSPILVATWPLQLLYLLGDLLLEKPA